MEILSSITEVVKEFWDQLKPAVILDEYEHGVMLRFGKYKKDLSAGIYFKIPIVDECMFCRKSITTMPIKNQALTTIDGHSIIVESIVKYQITNAKKYLLEVDDAVDAINDITQGKIKGLVMSKDWNEILEMKDEDLTDIIKKEAREWGIKVSYVTITSLVKARVYKVVGDNPWKAE